MRLARALLLLANFGNDVRQEPIPVKVNQETLAALIVGRALPAVYFREELFGIERELCFAVHLLDLFQLREDSVTHGLGRDGFFSGLCDI